MCLFKAYKRLFGFNERLQRMARQVRKEMMPDTEFVKRNKEILMCQIKGQKELN